MRLAGITIVRNECDIVEAFVRHNGAVLDQLYVLDNNSSDGTLEISNGLGQAITPSSWAVTTICPITRRARPQT